MNMAKRKLVCLDLMKTVREVKDHVLSSDFGVVIEDRYPKAKNHFLVLPKENIPTIYNLTKDHLQLLDKLHMLAIDVLEVKHFKLEDFKLGFHRDPSMRQLHLHVISQDFISDCLKTKKHWNSFNTKLFLPYEELYNELKADGCVKKINEEE
ncbi:aprataxin-like protein, partial [Teleopsis dalmanni]|uniref:aprataxin-like protein n=1 Tax=Teleopsis dalmanni TaxID=139649 RepID=UPI0018CDDD5E